jgi:hypothetical protein
VIKHAGLRGLREFLQELGLAPPLDVGLLVERLGEKRGRPLKLLAHPIGVPGPFGCWIAGPSADYVVYQRETSRAHQRHIVLHEIGHILAGHTGSELLLPRTAPTEPEMPEMLAPSSVDQVLFRDSATGAQEQEAERIATILTSWSTVADTAAPDNGVLGLVENAFRGDGWQ